jgi:glycosyltransferase involved in cell wall biosynthesis
MPDVILPVLNEARALPWVLERMPAGYRAIVVDNGSTDGSPEVAAAAGAEVVREPRRGYGAACYAGLGASSADVVAFVDADGALDPADLPAVCGPVLEGRLDLVLGARWPEPGAWPVHARVANRVLGRIVERRTGTRLRDLGPMRAARRDALLALGLRDRRSGWPLEMILLGSAAGWRIGEVPVRYGPRRAGKPKETGTLAGTIRAVRDMGSLLLSGRPSSPNGARPPV